MRNTLMLVSVVLLAGNTSHCNLSGPDHGLPSEFSHSVATMICGPTDGPATGILLGENPIPSPTDPSYPYVRVSIWEPVTQLKSRYLISSSSDEVSAIYVTSEGEFVPASSGQIRIDGVGPNNQIKGSVNLRFPAPGHAVVDSFDAPWIESFILCG